MCPLRQSILTIGICAVDFQSLVATGGPSAGQGGDGPSTASSPETADMAAAKVVLEESDDDMSWLR